MILFPGLFPGLVSATPPLLSFPLSRKTFKDRFPGTVAQTFSPPPTPFATFAHLARLCRKGGPVGWATRHRRCAQGGVWQAQDAPGKRSDHAVNTDRQSHGKANGASDHQPPARHHEAAPIDSETGRFSPVLGRLSACCCSFALRLSCFALEQLGTLEQPHGHWVCAFSLCSHSPEK